MKTKSIITAIAFSLAVVSVRAQETFNFVTSLGNGSFTLNPNNLVYTGDNGSAAGYTDTMDSLTFKGITYTNLDFTVYNNSFIVGGRDGFQILVDKSPSSSESTLEIDVTGDPGVVSGISANDLVTVLNSFNALQASSFTASALYTTLAPFYQSSGSVTSFQAVVQTHRGATATAVLSGGFVVGITVNDGGYGYTNVPAVHIIGGGGSNALVTATISGGIVTGITVNNPGAGYGATPLVSIAPPVVPLPLMSVSPASYLFFSGLQQSFGDGNLSAAYFLMKNIAGVWVNQESVFGMGGTYIVSQDGTYSLIVDGVASTDTYDLAKFPIPVQAGATAQVVNGFVTGITITNYGGGYTVAPTVQIVGGGGSGAQAVAGNGVTDGGFPYEVSSIIVTAPGSGYTNTPSVVIGSPDATLQFASPPAITPMMRLTESNMSTNLAYELQTSPDLTHWTNAGSSFLPATSTSSNYLYATNATGFFRLMYVP